MTIYEILDDTGVIHSSTDKEEMTTAFDCMTNPDKYDQQLIDMLHITNTLKLTETQEDKAFMTVTRLFEEEKNIFDFSHFAFLGTRLNLDSMNFECVFEVHCDLGGFCVTVEMNKKVEVLKRTFKIKELN